MRSEGPTNSHVSFYDDRWSRQATKPSQVDFDRVSLVVENALGAMAHLTAPSVLDVGCGNGWILAMLQKRAPAGTALFGVEPSNVGVLHAMKMVPTANVFHGTLEQYDPERRFDIITCSEVIEHMACSNDAAHHLARLAAPGGTLILTTPNARYLDDYFRVSGEHVTRQPIENWLSRREIREIFARAFDLLVLTTFDSTFYFRTHPGLHRIRRVVHSFRGGWRVWNGCLDPILLHAGYGLYQLAVMRRRDHCEL